MNFAYHVTQRRKLKQIRKNGLIPHIPEDYGEKGDINGVYLFKTEDDARTALMQWFGERIEDWEEENNKIFDEICLEINISGLEDNLFDSVEYEWICLVPIESSRILRIFEI